MTVNHELAVQLAYLVSGIDSVLRLERLTDRVTGEVNDNWLTDGNGHIGMVHDLVPLAYEVTQHIQVAAKKHNHNYPGVFEYEVTEPLGKWYAENPGTTREQFTAELHKLTEEFFTQDD